MKASDSNPLASFSRPYLTFFSSHFRTRCLFDRTNTPGWGRGLVAQSKHSAALGKLTSRLHPRKGCGRGFLDFTKLNTTNTISGNKMARTPFWGAILILIYPELRYACSGLQAHTPIRGWYEKILGLHD